jgi:hypothetical protein
MTDILFPPGRMVGGSLYKVQDKDAAGKPRVFKSGTRIGQPNPVYYFSLAIPKTAADNGHWANTPWGNQIWNIGHAGYQRIAEHLRADTIAWKVTDGDSTTPNTKGVKPCEREGYPGHWVLNFSSGYAPRIYHFLPGAEHPVPWLDVDAINAGDFIEVQGNIECGEPDSLNPSVFLNHRMVCFRGYGQRIILGVDVATVGFGAAPAPAGASLTPVGSAIAPPPPGVPAAGTPVIPGANPGYHTHVAPPVAPVGAVVPSTGYPQPTGAPPIPGAPAPAPMPAAAPLIVTSHPGILQAPIVAPPVAAAPRYTMLQPALGNTREQLLAQGWTDQMMVSNGLMVIQ